MKLFSGTSNPRLTENVSKLLNIPVSLSEVVRFGNSEVRVRIIDKVENEICAVIQPTSNPTDTRLMEFFFYCDGLRRNEARKVIGILPYFGYARQDIQHRVGESVSANVVIRFLESIGFNKIYTIDLHDEATEGVFSIPFKNLTALPILAKEVRNFLGSTENVVVVTPDQSGVERARKFGDAFYEGKDFSIGVVEKKRNLKEIHESKALDLYGDVEDKCVILVDDIVTSGGTLINAATLCKDHGAKQVISAIVHHDFASDTPSKLIESPIEKFFTTDTIVLRDQDKFDKLIEVSVAPLIADALRHLTQ